MRIVDILDTVTKIDLPFFCKSFGSLIKKVIEGAIWVNDTAYFAVDEILDTGGLGDLENVEIRDKSLANRL